MKCRKEDIFSIYLYVMFLSGYNYIGKESNNCILFGMHAVLLLQVNQHVQLMCTTHASILHQVCGLQGLCGHSHVLELKDGMVR